VLILILRSPTECDVSECDREASILMRPWPTRDCCAMGRRIQGVSDKHSTFFFGGTTVQCGPSPP
jgi:hypothetical protein